MMEYILEEEDKEDFKEEENENTHANASGISLAVRPWLKKYSLILPILIFRSRRVVVVDIFFVVSVWSVFSPFFWLLKTCVHKVDEKCVSLSS